MRLAWASILLVAACGAAQTPPTEEEEPDLGPPPPIAVTLRLTDAGDHEETGVPRTHVELVVIDPERGRGTTDVGHFDGACTPSGDSVALARVECWWAGATTELRLLKEADTLLVQRTVVDEMTGPGDPETLVSVELPTGARVRSITP